MASAMNDLTLARQLTDPLYRLSSLEGRRLAFHNVDDKLRASCMVKIVSSLLHPILRQTQHFRQRPYPKTMRVYDKIRHSRELTCHSHLPLRQE